MRRLLALALALTLGSLLALGGGSAAAPAPAGFSVPEPATLTGKTVGPNLFSAAGVAKECEQTTFSGSLAGSSPTLAPVPLFADCTAHVLSELPVKWVIAGCAWVLRQPAPIGGGKWESSVDLTCPGELPLEWNIYETPQGYREGANVCVTSMSSQRRIGSAVISRSGEGLRIEWDLDRFRYQAYGLELLCGSINGTTQRDAEYRATSILHAEDQRGRPVPLSVGG